MELHTSELVASCLKSVELRFDGKAEPRATTALYRGLVFGEACRLIHADDRWSDDCGSIVSEASVAVLATLKEEGRELSATVARDIEIINGGVARRVGLYADRFADRFSRCRLLGCEVPIRWEFDVDSEEVQFASHLDLLAQDERGRLFFDDWKLREKSPTQAYLSRHMQFGAYCVAVRRGRVMIDGDWFSLEEWPEAYWIDAERLAPYARGGSVGGRAWKAGDERPEELIRVRASIEPENEPIIMEELATRVRMMRMGMWPTNPDPTGCFVCESRQWCPSFGKEQLGDSEE